MNKTCVIFDLDDTLYKEIDYLKSAYCNISDRVCKNPNERISLYQTLLLKYYKNENPFAYLVDRDSDLNLEQLLEWYRYHTPKIHLTSEIGQTLSFLARQGYILGIITDGRSITQRNKIVALGLQKYIADNNIVISEEFGSEKPAEENYTYFVERYNSHNFVYIGDNPSKDFITPNKLGWLTVGIRDNGQNIHKQKTVGPEYEPIIWINEFRQIPAILFSSIRRC